MQPERRSKGLFLHASNITMLKRPARAGEATGDVDGFGDTDASFSISASTEQVILPQNLHAVTRNKKAGRCPQ